jgi:hypothetical protein
LDVTTFWGSSFGGLTFNLNRICMFSEIRNGWQDDLRAFNSIFSHSMYYTAYFMYKKAAGHFNYLNIHKIIK